MNCTIRHMCLVLSLCTTVYTVQAMDFLKSLFNPSEPKVTCKHPESSVVSKTPHHSPQNSLELQHLRKSSAIERQRHNSADTIIIHNARNSLEPINLDGYQTTTEKEEREEKKQTGTPIKEPVEVYEQGNPVQTNVPEKPKVSFLVRLCCCYWDK